MQEIWKNIRGPKRKYQVSNLGNVRNDKGKLLKFSYYSNGYLKIRNKNFDIRAHQAVACAFISNPLNKAQINHINGIKTDNRVENLEWCTASENQKHAYKIGLKRKLNTFHKFEKHPFAKTNSQQVKVIRWLKIINPKISWAKIGKIFGLSRGTIGSILNNKTWNFPATSQY